MNLVFVTQELDPGHPALGQTVELVTALAARVDELAVVTRALHTELPANAVAHMFDAGGKIRRGIAFERALAGSLGGADAVVVHMVPQFALLAAPLAKGRRVPLLLWYTHWHRSRALVAATKVVDVALSVDASSYPIATPKLRAIGHAIDVDRFAGTPPEAHGGPLRLLALGRTARWKGLGTLLESLPLVEGNVSLEIRGPSLTGDERAHRAELERRIASEGLPAQVLPPVPRDEVPALLAHADVVVSPNEPRENATLDKAVFEAAACGRPVLSTSAAYEPLLGELPLELIARARDPRSLAEVITAIARVPLEARAAIGEELRRRVVEGHSLAHWADAVISVATEVRSARGTAGTPRSG